MNDEHILHKAERIGLESFTLIVAMLVHIISLIISIKTNEGHWFARSGSLLVMFGAFLEFRNLWYRQELGNKAKISTKYFGAEPEKWMVPKRREILEKIILVVLVYGTVVWGYGDLAFKNT